jgi:hypothetical protein
MFGEKWESGTGTIVFAENKDATKRHQNQTYRDSITSNWVYVIEVSPPDQEAFREKVSGNHQATPLSGFHVGQTFQVLYDAKRQKIKWDITDPTIAARLPHKRTNTPASMNARLAAVLDGEPAAAGTSSRAVFDARSLSPEQRREAVAANKLMLTDPEAGRAAMAALASTPLGSGPAPAQAAAPARSPAPSAANLVDELAKLADLKAQGVLSGTEFAAAKKKLLGG